MFNRKTVFILGAGASWHYGYPTGEELVRKVVSAAVGLGEFFEVSGKAEVQIYPKFVSDGRVDQSTVANIGAPWFAAQKKCFELADRLHAVNPLVIDYFLGQNPPLQEVGKLLICCVIMASEESYLRQPTNPLQPTNPNRPRILGHLPLPSDRDDWCRFVVHKLVTNCKSSGKLCQNKVNFITFNYDMSLEYALSRGLGAIHIFGGAAATEFFTPHVSGAKRRAAGSTQVGRDTG